MGSTTAGTRLDCTRLNTSIRMAAQVQRRINEDRLFGLMTTATDLRHGRKARCDLHATNRINSRAR